MHLFFYCIHIRLILRFCLIFNLQGGGTKGVHEHTVDYRRGFTTELQTEKIEVMGGLVWQQFRYTPKSPKILGLWLADPEEYLKLKSTIKEQ